MITAKRLEKVQEYYFSQKLREVAKLRADGRDIINLGIGSPDLPPPPKVVEALNTALSSNGAHQYQPYKGIKELRDSIARFYEEFYDRKLDPETNILPLMGSKEGIMHISMAFLNPGDKVLIPNPGYPTYSSVARLLEAEAVEYELEAANNWLPDLDKLTREDLEGVKIMWVNYPHMPTGSVATESFFREVTRFAEEHQILVVNDNPYSFIQNEHPMSILSNEKLSDHIMELNSLSKSFNMAGWRVGMLAGSQKNINSVLRVKSNMDSGMFYPVQAGAVEALNMSQQWFDEQNAIYSSRKDLVLDLIRKTGCTAAEDQAGLFIWARVPENTTSEAVVDKLLYEHDIFIAPGFVFGTAGEAYVRFSLCASEDRILEAIKRIEK